MTSKSFFFQAEDGIRGRDVTGVQTCALPISLVAVARADDLLDLLARGLLLAVRGAHELIRLAREALEVRPADGAAEARPEPRLGAADGQQLGAARLADRLIRLGTAQAARAAPRRPAV